MPISLQWQAEVETAVADKRPVVVLESTVITHGLPYPQNAETALKMEAAVRDGGAVPATVAILNGRIHIGLSAEQIDELAQTPREQVRKCSRRDLPLAIAGRENGATTVAATMILAHLAGIEVFATGGIGGVHRGHPFDVSADLYELGRTPVTVVCSGAKSILDLPATCEVLETHGVPILGYGTDHLPAFFTPSSDLPVTARIDTAVDAARIIHARRQLQLQSGLLVTVPVPAGAGLSAAEAESATARAVREADEQGIHGAAATPWLLSRMLTLTDGRSMQANIALLENNARTAAQIATAVEEFDGRAA